MQINYDVRKLDKALEDFHNATGVSISVLSADFTPLGSKKGNNMYCRLVQSSKCGRNMCLEFNRILLEECKSAKKPLIKVCDAGLVEIAVPLIYNTEIIGYAILGHIRPADENFNGEKTPMLADKELAKDLFNALDTYTAQKLESIKNLAGMFGRYLILDNLLISKGNEYFERIKKYIEDNALKKVTPSDVSKGTYLSKSTVYSTVNSHLGCSLNEFIYRVKVERAKDMLAKTDLTVAQVAVALGFSGSSYFGKKFKEIVGISPIQFKKNSENETP